jgi:hypothetical protein
MTLIFVGDASLSLNEFLAISLILFLELKLSFPTLSFFNGDPSLSFYEFLAMISLLIERLLLIELASCFNSIDSLRGG